MPKCAICNKYFHPDVCVEKSIRGDYVVVCVFCHLDKTSIIIEDKNGKFVKKLSKDMANKEYMMYLDRLASKKEISMILSGKSFDKNIR